MINLIKKGNDALERHYITIPNGRGSIPSTTLTVPSTSIIVYYFLATPYGDHPLSVAGSVDGSSWTTIDTLTGSNYSSTSSTSGYLYYKFTSTRATDNASKGIIEAFY